MFTKKTNQTFIGLATALAILLAVPNQALPCQAGKTTKTDNTPSKKENPKKTRDPIVMAEGSVTETAVDASLPGVTFGWSHSRSYSSSLSDGTYIQGEKWKADWFTAFLAQGDSGSVELYMNHVSKRVFTYSGGSYVPPDDFLATLTHDTGGKVFVLKLTDRGETFTFYDFDNSWNANSRGMLKSRTDRYGQETIQYTYDPSSPGGRITSVITTQGWTVSYSYVASGVNIGRIATIEVKNGSSQVLQRVKYTYYADGAGYSTGCGSNGDLIAVEILTRGSADDLAQSGDAYFAIKRITMYRYFRDGDADGVAHQLKMMLSPASVQKAMSDGGKTAGQLLALADIGIVAGSSALRDYANTTYTYYSSDFDTTDVDTAEGGVGGDNENLHDKYGGLAFDETGYARSQTIRKDYGGFLGARTYFYMGNHDPEASGLNAVTRILVEDTKDTGTRRVYGINKDRMLLREVFVDDPDAGTPRYWCKSLVRGATKDANTNNVNQVAETRMPSAHDCIDALAEVRSFLDAESDNDWTSTDILNASSGVIYTYAYDAEGFLVEEKVKKGRTGSEYYLRVVEYGDGTANKPKYLPVKEYSYPAAVISKTDASRLTTEYAYTFHDSSTVAQRLKTRTITYPTVPADQNGPATAVTTSEYYDDRGRLRWTQDGEGYVNYYSYNANTGGMGYIMVDVETDDLPTDITSGSSPDWIAWSDAVPFTHADDDSLHLVTKYKYDDQGRQVSIEDAENMVTCTAYGDNQTRVYGGWDAASHTCALPIQVAKTNNDDLATDVYTVRPSGVTIGYSGNLPTGFDGGETQADYITWTRYAYNDSTAMLEKADRYHDIPGVGAGEMGANFHRTFHRYDTLGLRTHTIQVVSGTDETGLTGCVEQVTKTEYDALSRVKSVQRGVSNASHVMKTATIYDTDPTTLRKVAEDFYDETAPGSGTGGVGDGLVTSTLAYYDADNIDANHAVETIHHYNWRGQLIGIEPEAAPYTVRDVDNMGRLTAVAQYQANVTWSTIVDDDDFAATVESDAGTSAKRGSLSKTYYDKMGRVFRVEVYSVTADTGAAGDKLVTDNYFDRNSRLVASYSPAQGGLEYAYDGAGREIETRVVVELEGTKYQNGAFQYRSPLPEADDGGDDQVLRISRTEYDKVGNPTESINIEMNHDDTTNVGIKLDSNPKDYIQTFTYRWYEPDTHRLVTTAFYGAGDANWTYASAPTYETYANRPTASGSTCLVTRYDYADGRLEKVHDPKGLIVKYGYDDLGRTEKVEEQDAGQNVERVSLTRYDGLSNVTRQVADLDRDGVIDEGSDQVTTYAYADDRDASLTTRVQYPDGDAVDDNVKFAYNLNGTVATRTAQKTAGDANVITFVYDGTLGRLERQRVTTPGAGVDGTVRSMKYTMDNLGRRQKVTSYSDDDCTTAVNEVVFEYNGLGALTIEHQEHNGVKGGGTLAVQYAYEATSGTYNGLANVLTKGLRLTDTTYPNARKSFRNYGTANSLADKLSRLAAIKDDNGSGGEDDTLASYSYNGVGTMVVEDFEQPDVKLDYFGGTPGTYAGFDRFGRVKQQLWRNYDAPADRDKFAYDHDYNSNRKYRENVVAGAAGKKLDELYAYDDMDRLADFKRGKLDGPKTEIPYQNPADRLRREEWTLTDTGNWQEYKIDQNGDGDYSDNNDLDQDRTHNDVNEIGGISELGGQSAWADPGHSARGNMTTVPKPADMENTYSCTYDAWNRLVEVKDGANVVAHYRYDGLGRRIRKYVPDNGDWTVTEYYYSAGWQVLEIRRDDGKTRSGDPLSEPTPATTLREQYVWSPRYIDAPILRDRETDDNPETGDLGKTDSGLDERLYYLTDANMNVTAVVDADTGAVVERYAYDPYGKVIVLNGASGTDPDVTGSVAEWDSDADGVSDVDNRILYCGYYRDAETGLYHVRNRMYHPTLGRFIHRDSIGYVDGMNLYEYVGGMATGAVDPMGTDRWITYGPLPGHTNLVYEYYENGKKKGYRKVQFYGEESSVILSLVKSALWPWGSKGVVEIVKGRRPRREPDIKTTRHADQVLHILAKAFEKNPPRYAVGYHCRTFVQSLAGTCITAGHVSMLMERRTGKLNQYRKAYMALGKTIRGMKEYPTVTFTREESIDIKKAFARIARVYRAHDAARQVKIKEFNRLSKIMKVKTKELKTTVEVYQQLMRLEWQEVLLSESNRCFKTVPESYKEAHEALDRKALVEVLSVDLSDE